MRTFLKFGGSVSGSVFLIAVGFAVVLLVNWGISQSRAEKDTNVLQRASPDGKMIAENSHVSNRDVGWP
jgi:hypothetical protein